MLFSSTSLFHLMVLPSMLVTSQGRWLFDLPLRVTFSPALPSDCFAIDFPGRASSQARVFRERALREHRRSTGSVPLFSKAHLRVVFLLLLLLLPLPLSVHAKDLGELSANPLNLNWIFNTVSEL